MRNAFADEITKLAVNDERIVVLSGDIGNQLFNKFKDQCPGRFFNCGIAEANMMSVAAGLAMSGLRPVCYTITPFTTTRCLEQIRVDVCYHHVPVTIVGVGSGLSYASLGSTHHSCEDIAFLRVLPHMNVICPGDAWEVRQSLHQVFQRSEPAYIRLGKKGEPVIHTKAPNFVIGKCIPLRRGKDVALLSTGNMLPFAVEAGEILAKENIDTEVVSFHTVKPLDVDYLAQAFSSFKLVVTIEEHSILGGFGSSVSEWLTDFPAPFRAKLCKIAAPDKFWHGVGEQEHAREDLGLTTADIVKNVQKRLREIF